MKIPAVPLRNVPPAFKVPASENTIRESTPSDVMLPETVAVPVEIRIWVNLVPPVVPERATVSSAEKVPAPTSIWFTPPAAGRGMVTVPLAVKDAVLSAKSIELVAVVFAAKVMVVQYAA